MCDGIGGGCDEGLGAALPIPDAVEHAELACPVEEQLSVRAVVVRVGEGGMEDKLMAVDAERDWMGCCEEEVGEGESTVCYLLPPALRALCKDRYYHGNAATIRRTNAISSLSCVTSWW